MMQPLMETLLPTLAIWVVGGIVVLCVVAVHWFFIWPRDQKRDISSRNIGSDITVTLDDFAGGITDLSNVFVHLTNGVRSLTLTYVSEHDVNKTLLKAVGKTQSLSVSYGGGKPTVLVVTWEGLHFSEWHGKPSSRYGKTMFGEVLLDLHGRIEFSSMRTL